MFVYCYCWRHTGSHQEKKMLLTVSDPFLRLPSADLMKPGRALLIVVARGEGRHERQVLVSQLSLGGEGGAGGVGGLEGTAAFGGGPEATAGDRRRREGRRREDVEDCTGGL